MTPDDGQNDHILAAVASLRTYDISRRHTRRLHRRCHARLQPQGPGETRAPAVDGAVYSGIIAPALGGAWCLLYLVEIIRRAAAIHGYFGAP